MIPDHVKKSDRNATSSTVTCDPSKVLVPLDSMGFLWKESRASSQFIKAILDVVYV